MYNYAKGMNVKHLSSKLHSKLTGLMSSMASSPSEAARREYAADMDWNFCRNDTRVHTTSRRQLEGTEGERGEGGGGGGGGCSPHVLLSGCKGSYQGAI